MAKITDDQIREHLSKLAGWERAGNEIVRTFKFANYYETMAFVNAVAWIAHQRDHHPDLEVGYNKCRVGFSTHSAGGVTDMDVECARLVSALAPDRVTA